MEHPLQPDTMILAFDDAAWRVVGDLGNCLVFYRPARIVDHYYDHLGRLCYNVQWAGQDFISRGHFADGVRPLEWTGEGFNA